MTVGNREVLLGNNFEEELGNKKLQMASERQKKAVFHWETAGNSGKQVKNWETGVRKKWETDSEGEIIFDSCEIHFY